MREVAASLADNISSDDPICDQLQQGKILQITPLATNFNMDY